jgi:ribosomal protein S5
MALDNALCILGYFIKSIGSNNPNNLVIATIQALSKIKA